MRLILIYADLHAQDARLQPLTSGPAPVPVTIFGGPHAAELVDLVAGNGDRIVGDRWFGPGSITVDYNTEHTPIDPHSRPQIDVIDGLLRAVRRQRRPDHVLLVATHGVNLTTIVGAMLTESDLMRHINLDGVVVTVDGVAATTHLIEHETVGNCTDLDAIAIADTIAIGRSASLTSEGLAALRRALHAANTIGPVVEIPELGTGAEPVQSIRSAVLGLKGWCGRPKAVRSSTTLRPDSAQAPATVVLREPGSVDRNAVERWIDRVIDTHATGLLRLQGAFSVGSKPNAQLLCRGVGPYAASSIATSCPRRTDERDSVVLVVGRNLNVDQLASEFAATRVQ